MTSINIQTISDKAEFNNYFSEPITLPKNAMIAMPKSNMSVPLSVMPQVNAPQLSALDILKTAFKVEIDGINLDITWKDLYDSHVQIPGNEFIPVGGEGDYYAGFGNDGYVYLPNSRPLMFNAGFVNNVQAKTDFNTILANAITNKFDFYDCFPTTIYSSESQVQSDKGLINAAILTSQNFGQVIAVDSKINCLKEWGFTVEYNAYNVFSSAATFINVNNDDKVGWVQGAALHAFRGGGAGACCCFAEQMNFDYNGGWITTFPNITTLNPNAKMSWGIQLLGQGSQAGDAKLPQVAYDTKLIDFGIEFGYDATAPGHYVYNVIEPPQLFNSDAGLGPGGEATQHTKFNPNLKVNRFNNNGDHFFIQIVRGNDLHNTKGFVVNILHGQNVNPHTDPNAVVIASYNININPQQHINAVYLANTDAGTDAWEFNTNAFIQKTAQTIAQGDMSLTDNINNTGAMLIAPQLGDNAAMVLATSTFFNSWGLNILNNTVPNQIFSYVEGTSSLRKATIPINFSSAPTSYFLGSKGSTNFFLYKESQNNQFEQIILDTNITLDNLPQQLNVNINNIPIQNFAGTLPTGTVSDTKVADTRLVGTIPIDIGAIDYTTGSINLSYEPYNLLYRPLSNPNNFTVNQLAVEVYYKDFDTNKKKTIQHLFGNMNIEFHIKAGGAPTINNNLRPY